jgi:hypothetical protein
MRETTTKGLQESSEYQVTISRYPEVHVPPKHYRPLDTKLTIFLYSRCPARLISKTSNSSRRFCKIVLRASQAGRRLARRARRSIVRASVGLLELLKPNCDRSLFMMTFVRTPYSTKVRLTAGTSVDADDQMSTRDSGQVLTSEICRAIEV